MKDETLKALREIEMFGLQLQRYALMLGELRDELECVENEDAQYFQLYVNAKAHCISECSQAAFGDFEKREEKLLNQLRKSVEIES